MTTALFVYGTLMPGHLRWNVLAPHAQEHRPATVTGSLYDTGRGWPAATFTETRDAIGGVGRAEPARDVPGWLVVLDDGAAPAVLAQLDEIEGVAPEGSAEEVALRHPYRRQRVRTTEGDEVWAYEAATVPSDWVAIERWSTQPER